MTSRAAFLDVPYGAYFHRDLPKEDEELTHVGPGTPCGEYLRRFWQPVAISAELNDVPKHIRIMGEDLVVFRDGSGGVGLLELHCPHRGTSLEFAQISQKGIRCCYHGWLMDVDGKILETPGEPADSTLKERLRHGAYPVLEYKGLVFAYVGPPDKKPAFPIYDVFEMPGRVPDAGDSFIQPCNWVQVKENSMDPAHLLFLHTIGSEVQVAEEVAQDVQVASEWEYLETPIGMLYIDTRRIGDNAWVRIADYMVPTAHQFPPSGQLKKEEDFYGRPESVIWAVPVDDTNTMTMRLWHMPEGKKRAPGPGFGQTADRPYEDRQRSPGDHDAQVGQRPIAIHGLEHLATSDRGIIMFRNLVRRGIRAVQNGEDPKGVAQRAGEVIPTYCSDTIRPIPPATTPEADRQLLRDTGRQVAEEYINNPAALSGGTA